MSQRSIISTAAIILLLLCLSACGTSTGPDDSWEWFNDLSSIRFLTKDWSRLEERYTAGDSLTIALKAMTMYVDFSNHYGQLISACGDTEDVNLWDRLVPTPFFYAAILTVTGTRFPTHRSVHPVVRNGILDVVQESEYLTISYPIFPGPDSVQVLSDTTIVRR